MKYKSNKSYDIYFEFHSEMYVLLPLTPHIISYTINFLTEEPDKKQLNVRVFLVVQCDKASPLKLGQACVSFVSFRPDSEFVSCQFCHVSLIFIKC